MTTYTLVYITAICAADIDVQDNTVGEEAQAAAKKAINEVMLERGRLLAGAQIIGDGIPKGAHVERPRMCLVHRFDRNDDSTWHCDFAHISGLPANPHVLIDGVAHHIRDSVAYIVRHDYISRTSIDIVSEEEYRTRFITPKQAIEGAY